MNLIFITLEKKGYKFPKQLSIFNIPLKLLPWTKSYTLPINSITIANDGFTFYICTINNR